MFPQNKISQLCLLTLTSIAITAALIYMRPVAVPFTISLFVYSALSPSLKLLQKKFGLSHGSSVALTFLLFVVFSSLIVLFLSQSIQSFIQGAEIYQARFYDFIDLITDYGKKWGLPIDRSSIRTAVKNLPIFDLVTSLTGNIFSILGNILVVIIFVMFMLFGKQNQKHSTSKPSSFHAIYDEIEHKVSQYTLAKVFISGATAISASILFYFLDLELLLIFAVLTFLLNFIPNIGSLMAVLVTLPIALLQFGFTFKFYFLLIVFNLLQFFWGNIAEPKMLGDTLDLHPNTILFSLLFWGLVWGVAGMFLAVPITVVIRIILSRISNTQAISEMMAGRF